MNKIVYFILIAALVAQISAVPAEEPKKEADAAKKEADAAKKETDAGKEKVKDAAEAAKGVVDGAAKKPSEPPAPSHAAPAGGDKPLGIVQKFGQFGADCLKVGEEGIKTAFGLGEEAAKAHNPFNLFSWF